LESRDTESVKGVRRSQSIGSELAMPKENVGNNENSKRSVPPDEVSDREESMSGRIGGEASSNICRTPVVHKTERSGDRP
jgi:hypothetical protein